MQPFRFTQKRKNARSVPSRFALGARAEIPSAIEHVDVGGSELVEHHIAARFRERCELFRERPIFAQRGRRDLSTLAVSQENLDGVGNRDAAGSLGCSGRRAAAVGCRPVPVLFRHAPAQALGRLSHSHLSGALRLKFPRSVPETKIGQAQRFQPFFRSSNSPGADFFWMTGFALPPVAAIEAKRHASF